MGNRKIMDKKTLENDIFKESQIRYKSLVENSVYGITIVKGEKILFVNRAMLKLFGCKDMDEMVGQKFTKFIAPEDREVILKRGLEREKGKDVPGYYEFKALRKDGTIFDADICVNRISYKGEVARQAILKDISVQKKAQRKEREAIRRVSMIIDGISDVVGIADTDGIVTEINDSIESWGYKKEEVIGTPVSRYLSKDSLSKLKIERDATSKGKTVRDMEFVGVRKNKSKFFVLASITPVLDANDNLIARIFTLKDISERRAMEEKLKENEKKYRELADLLPQTVFEFDKDMKIIVTNKIGFSIFGYTTEDLERGINALRVIAPEDKLRAIGNIQRVLRGKDIGGIEYTALRKDGTRFPCVIYVNRIMKEDKPFGLRGILIDISDRKKMLERIEESEKLYRTLFEQAADSIVLVEPETAGFIAFNDAAYKNLGYSRKEFEDMKISDIEAIENKPDTKKHIKNIIKKGQDIFETKHKTKKGEIRNIIVNNKTIPIGGKIKIQSIWHDITDQKKAEQDIRNTLNRTKDILEKAPFGIYLVNKQGDIEYVNNAMIKISGDTPEQFKNINIFDLPSYKRTGLDKEIRHALEGKIFSLNSLEYTSYYGKKTTVRNIIGIPYQEKDENKALIFVEDITEQKKAEQEVKKAKEYAELLFRVTPSAIFTVDTNQCITSWNKKAEEITGYTASDLIGKRCTLFAKKPCEDECGLYADNIKKPVIGKECTIKTKKGQMCIISKNVDRLEDREGNIIGGIESFEDITEHKNMVEALKESEERFRKIFDNATDGILLVDPESRKFYMANKMFCRMLGYSLEEIRNLEIIDIHPEESLSYVIDQFEKQSKGDFTLAKDIPVKRKNGSVFYTDVNSTPVELGRRTYILGIFRDITERKQSKEELQKAFKELKETQGQLIQAEKLAAVGQMAAGVAHEINNPLFAISGEAQMLLRDQGKDLETHNVAKIVVEQSERIKDIIEKLLEFSHKKTTEESEMEPLEVNKVLEESLNLLGYQIKRTNVNIIKNLSPHLPKVLGDNNQLQQVFLNIMLNAVQAMEGVGELTIESRLEKIARYGKRQEEISSQDQEMIIIEFKDTGKGMNEESLKKLFVPFFSTKEKGTGLGLPITYKIIQEHKGFIEAHSKLGEGSVFVIKLPAFKEGEKS